MLKLWRLYQNCLAVHPVKTQVISSGLIWGVGDIAAQTITHSTARTQPQIRDEDKELKINWKRVATTSFFGFAFVGPIGHLWYEGLDHYIRTKLLLRPNSFRFVATKVAVDGILFGPLDLLVFFSYMGLSSGKSIHQVKEDVKRDFLPAFILEGGIWPMVQVVNFRFIPVRYIMWSKTIGIHTQINGLFSSLDVIWYFVWYGDRKEEECLEAPLR